MTSKAEKAEKRAQQKAPMNTERYEKGWGAFKEDPTIEAVKRAVPELGPTVCKKLVKIGVPHLNLPSYERKMSAINSLVMQMDVDESARSIAMGRGALRKGISMFLRRINRLEKDIDSIPATEAMRLLPRYVEMNEALSRQPTEDDSGLLLGAVADMQTALGSMIGEISARKIPQTRKNGVKALTPEEVKELDG